MAVLDWQTMGQRLKISLEEIEQFCKRWQIVEFALFGSVLREDFRFDSDIDVLVRLAPNHRWGLEWVEMRDELQAMFQRDVDLISRDSLEHSPNLLRRQTILDSAKVRDRQALLDLIRAVQQVMKYGQNLDLAGLADDDEKQAAILYRFVVIGEATKRLFLTFREQNPDLYLCLCQLATRNPTETLPQQTFKAI